MYMLTCAGIATKSIFTVVFLPRLVISSLDKPRRYWVLNDTILVISRLFKVAVLDVSRHVLRVCHHGNDVKNEEGVCQNTVVTKREMPGELHILVSTPCAWTKVPICTTQGEVPTTGPGLLLISVHYQVLQTGNFDLTPQHISRWINICPNADTAL